MDSIQSFKVRDKRKSINTEGEVASTMGDGTCSSTKKQVASLICNSNCLVGIKQALQIISLPNFIK